MARQRIRVTLTNRTASLTRPYPYDDLLPFWSYTVPGFRFMSRRYPGWDGKKKLLKYDKLPSGLFLATRQEIEENLQVKFQVSFKRQLPQTRDGQGLTSDRSYQNDCVQKMIENGRCGGLVISSTGSGKTRIAGQLASRIEGPILFVVDQLDLLWQAKKEIQSLLNEKIGFVGDQKFKPRRVTIATVQTMHLHRKDERFREWTDQIQVMLIDEIHTQLNKRNFDVVQNIQPRACYGLTATLQLKKKEVRLRAYGLTGPVIFTFPVKQGMQENVLSKGVVIRCLVQNRINQ